MTSKLALWLPRLLWGLEMVLFAVVVSHHDSGLKTEIRDGIPFGTCSQAEFETIGMVWLGMTTLAFLGCLLSLFKRRGKWTSLILFVVPVMAATTLAKYSEDRYPPCWERPAETSPK